MKKYIALLLTLIITASTLAACAAGVPSSSSSHVPVSSSVASVPSSLPVSSLSQVAASSTVSITQSSVASINNNSYDVYFILFEGTLDEKNFKLNIILPDGVYYKSPGGIFQEEAGNIPYTVFEPELSYGTDNIQIYSGGIHPILYCKGIDFFIDNDVVQWPHYGEFLNYHLSDDISLPPFTFYRFDSFVALTDDLVDPGREIFTPIKITQYFLPVYQDFCAIVWFFNNFDSVEAKEYYEQIVRQITIVEI